MSRAPLYLLVLCALSCNQAQPPEVTSKAPSTPAAASAPVPESPAETFGGQLDEGVPLVALPQVQSNPQPLLGSTLRTQGRVERVCQKKGCWLELGEPGAEPLRVPMAGHAFFIPQHAVGQRAEIQGTLTAMPLPEAHAAHVASEGATALGPLALQATAVKLLP